MFLYVNVGHFLILSWTYTYKLIERPHFLDTNEIWVKIKSVPEYFLSLVLNFTAPMYILLFLYSEIYIVHIINCEWSRSVNFLLRMFCMQYKHIFFQHIIHLILSYETISCCLLNFDVVWLSYIINHFDC